MTVPGYSQKNPHVDKQYFNGQYNGVKVYARVCTPLRISAPGYVWKHKRGGVVSQNSTLHLARLSDLEDLAVGRSRQEVIKTHEYRPTVGYGIMTSGRIIGGDYFNLHTLAHEGPMMYGRILPMFFGTVRFLPNDHGYYLTEFRSYASSTKNTYDATVEPGLTLDLGSVTCEGYATMSPAKKYFAVPGKKLIESWPIPALPEVVQITAHSVPGYCFDGWSGDGGCWPYKPSEDELVFDPPLALEDTDHTNKTIWIAMDNSKTITPGFVEVCLDYTTCKVASALSVRGHDVSNGSIICNEIPKIEYCCESLTEPKASDLLKVLHKYNVFQFDGHSGFQLGDPSEPGFESTLSPEQVANVGGRRCFPMKFVFMNMCAAATSGALWRDAFSPQCYIGWDASIEEWVAKDFDEYFWKKVGGGTRSAKSAYHFACNRLRDPWWPWEPADYVPIIIGETTF